MIFSKIKPNLQVKKYKVLEIVKNMLAATVVKSNLNKLKILWHYPCSSALNPCKLTLMSVEKQIWTS